MPAGGVQLSRRLSALSPTMSREEDLSLVLVVDKQANRVLWAESVGDVVDVLFSFLTLPLGTVVRVLGKQSELGCVDELYKSVDALDESCFQTPCCQDMLLFPRSAAERLCQDLPAKVDDSDLAFYTCSDESCVEVMSPPVYSTVFGASCLCYGDTDREIRWRGMSTEGDQNGVFVDRLGRFSITDDLSISPVSASTTISLLHRFGSEESQWEHMDVKLSRERVLTLLQKSLTSKTPLTDTFLQKSKGQPKEEVQLHPPIISTHDHEEGDTAGFKARLVKSRARNEVMYADIGEDTVDLLFSFLTIPLGSIVRLLGKASHIGCMDNLYQSVEKLCAAKYCAKLEKHRDMLLAPKIATHFGCSNQLLDVDETSIEALTMNTCADEDCCADIINPARSVCIHGKVARTALQLNPKLGNGSGEKGGNFAEGKAGTFMVTDEMTVMLNSSLSAIKILNGRNVHVDDLELREMAIGKKEALALLRGLLLSKTPLTQVFCSQTKKEEG